MKTTDTTISLNYYTGFGLGWTRKSDTNARGERTGLYLSEAHRAATAEGYKPVGTGPIPAGHEVVYIPTSTSPGFNGKCEKFYYSRWSRQTTTN